MKKQLLIITTLLSGYLTPAQSTTASVNLAEGKTNQSYYSLKNGELSNVDNQDWDIAFDVTARGSSIRINGQNGVELRVWPDGKIADWENVSISSINDWSQLYNSTKTWYDGAFDQNNTGTAVDLGWGEYNPTTHAMAGDSIYIIKLSDQTYRKFYIDKLYGGVYSFKYANIDGTEEVEATVTKEEYSDKNFGYYSILNNQVIDREPATADWDLVFGKYEANQGTIEAPYYMGFTGVLSNTGVTIAEARATDIDGVTKDDNPFNEEIDIIGSDWKKYDRASNTYSIVDNLVYFVNDKNAEIWKLSFTNFTTNNGEIEFTKELLSEDVAGFEDNSSIKSFAVYPNPASSFVHILFTAQGSDAQITITDPTGRLVKTENLDAFNNLIDIKSLSKGIYYLTLKVDGDSKTEKLVIK